MFTDFFNSRIKQAILNEKEYNNITPRILPSIEFRAPVRNYKEFYTKEQIDYLWDHRMIEEYQKCGATWERDCEEYWQFTNKGCFGEFGTLHLYGCLLRFMFFEYIGSNISGRNFV